MNKNKSILIGIFLGTLIVILGTFSNMADETTLSLSAFFVIYAIIVLAIFGFLIGMFIDCLQRPREKFPSSGESDKLIWCLAIFFANFIGAVMYYFLVYRKVDWRVQQ